MARYYVEFSQDCGYAAMQCHRVIEAPSWEAAHAGAVVMDAFGRPDAVFALPADMAGWTDEQVLAHYEDVAFQRQWTSPEDMARHAAGATS